MSGRQFSVEPVFFERFPDLRLVVCVTRGVAAAAVDGSLDADWTSAWDAASALDVPNAQSHPRVREFRECFKRAGVSMKRYPIAVEALLRRAMKGGPPVRIHPLVDFYNMLSVRHACPAGAFDLDETGANIELRLTREGDRFTALDAGESEAVEVGEMAYATDATVLTRHFMWRQSRQALVGTRTDHVFLVAEIPGSAGEEGAQAMRADMRHGLQRYFGLACNDAIVDARQPVLALD